MTRDDLAERIFREIFGAGKMDAFGYRKTGRSTYKWKTDFYDYKIITNSEKSAILYATYRKTNRLSMIRHYTYTSRLMDSSVRV